MCVAVFFYLFFYSCVYLFVCYYVFSFRVWICVCESGSVCDCTFYMHTLAPGIMFTYPLRRRA